jgi:hypothetical protein
LITSNLDYVEPVVAIEEALTGDTHLTPDRREAMIREIAARVAKGEFGDEGDLDDDAIAALVRNLGPRPRGQAGAARRVI